MKNLFIGVMIVLSSCSSNYYQVYSIKQIQESKPKEIEIKYNFWGIDREFECFITNTSDETVTIYMDKSYFVLNNQAFDYFQEQLVTHYSSDAITNNYGYAPYRNVVGTTGISHSYSNSYTIHEQRIITIPSGSYKIIRGFIVSSQYLKDCQLVKYPRKQSEVKYEFNSSPLSFSNIITYSIGNKETHIKDEFYVESLINTTQNEFIKTSKVKDCDKDVNMIISPYWDKYRFYIKYKAEPKGE